MRKVVVVLLLVLAGCGGDTDDPDAAPQKTTDAPAGPTAKPTVAVPRGEPAPEALSRFRCEKGKKDTWNASGVLANRGTSATTYQVTVYVGEAAGTEEKAKTRHVPSVATGSSVRFVVSGVPGPEDGGPCHVQVLARR